MISEPRNIVVGMEIVPLSIHVINLFECRLYSAFSIRMIPLVEVTAQDWC